MQRMQADRRLAPGRVLAWMCVIIFVNQLGFGAIIPVLPLYASSFDVSVSAIGATIAVFGGARMLSAMPSGRLSDHIGRRPTLALGGLIAVAGNLWSGYAGSFTEFLLARFVAGIGSGIVITIGGVILADISTPERRGRMMALYQGSFLFAVGVGPLPGGLLAEHFSLATPFIANAFAAFIVGLIAWFVIPETRSIATGNEEGAGPVLRFGAQIRLMIGKVGFMLVCLIGFTHAFVRTGGLFNLVPLVASSRLGLGAGQIGSGFALGSLLGLLATYPAGMIADRYGRKPLIVCAALMTGVSFFGFWLARDFAGFLLACVVWGVAAAVTGAAPSAYAADNAPVGMNAAAMSTYRALTDAGYVAGPLALGLMGDLAGAGPTLVFCAVAILTMALMFWRYAPESLRRQ
jgi:DHA1 family multidrug resistance protein-like MFS transporter